MTARFHTVLAALAALLVLAAAPTASAQSDSRTFVQIDYMSVPEGGETEYLGIEREVWKPIHQERMRRGLIRDWIVLEARLATSESAYTYLTLTVFDNFAALENAIPEDVLAAAHPDADLAAMMERTLASRDILHTEVWELVASAHPEEVVRPEDARYEVLNFMRTPPGEEDEYEATERDVWAPIHQARIDAENLSGWAVYRLVLPAGTAVNYNYLTIDSYVDFADYAVPVDEALMRAAHPDATATDLAAMTDRTNAARTIHKSELWNVVETAGDVRVDAAVSAVEQ